MGDDKIIKDFAEDARNKREENQLKTLLGAALKSQGGKKVQRIDISGIVELLTTRAEFNQFKGMVHTVLTKIEGLLRKVKAKSDLAEETADVLGRVLATLARKGICSQEDIIETTRLIEEGQARVKQLADEHADKTLDERLRLMRREGLDEDAVEEYEYIERRKAANRIVALHTELSKGKLGKDNEVKVKAKTFKEIIEVIRAENIPEAQVREYIRAFFPWADGVAGPVEADVMFCPECDRGYAVSPNPTGDLTLCECGKKLFPASEFVRPEKLGGKKAEEEQVEESETPEAEVVTEEPETPEVEEVEDPGLQCPPDIETATGHYDPSGPEAEKNEDGFSDCAGCGTPRSAHKRVLQLRTPTDEGLDEAEGCGSDEDEEGEAE